MSIPTPAMLAGRPRTTLTARPPGQPPKPPAPAPTAADDPFGARYARAVLTSDLHRHAKLIALTLASSADWATGRIPDDRQIGTRKLGVLTGLIHAQVHHSIAALADAGFLERRPAPYTDQPSRIALLIPDDSAAPR